jgi:hypothetical protein
MPPTRFRVVERGRRLEVIDTMTGQAVTSKPRSNPPMSSAGARRNDTPLLLDRIVDRSADVRATERKASGLPGAIRFDGTVSFTTRAFYDDRAPRTVTLNPARATMLRWTAFALLLLLIVTPVLLISLSWSSFPLTFALAAVAFNPKVRERLRAAITSLIDRYADPA